MFQVLDLFSGIGGFSLGLERTGGFKTVAFCEIEEFPRKVLKKHWPDVPIYHDIRELTVETLRQDGIVADVVTGGFPCQDISTAGRQAGLAGERSGLWSELCRIIGDIRPRYAIVENVSNLLSGPPERRGGWFGCVLGDLAECGYDAEWENIPASALGACHRRERVWLVAYPRGFGGVRLQHQLGKFAESRQGREDNALCSDTAAADPSIIRQPRQGRPEKSCNTSTDEPREAINAFNVLGWPTEPAVRGRNDGVSRKLDINRLRGIGNAVIPQIPELIGRAILEAESMMEAAE